MRKKKGGCLIEHKRPKVRSFGGFDGQGGVRAQAGSKAGLEIIIPPDHVVTGQLFFYVRFSFLFARVAVMEFSFFVQCSFLFVLFECYFNDIAFLSLQKYKEIAVTNLNKYLRNMFQK